MIVHSGDALRIGGRWEPTGQKIGGVLYAAAPKVARPAKRAAGPEVGRALLAVLQRWRYESDIGADLVLGYIGAANLGGAPSWRAHMICNGPRGCGKSWLTEVVAAALGAGAQTLVQSTP